MARGLLAALLRLTTACSASVAGPAAPAGHGCITAFDAATDYFPVKVEPTHATNFSLTYHRSYAVLTVRQPYPGGAPESYVLLRCGAPAPDLPAELADAQVVPVPVTSLYAQSTTQLQLIADIGALDVLTGVGTPDFASGPEVRAKIDAGEVRGFAVNGQIEAEQIIADRPDVLLSQGTDDPTFPVLRNAGVPVIGWAEYLDSSPLGQAEWIKAMGVLTGHEREAAAVFDEIVARYEAQRAEVAGLPPTPVLLGQLHQGSWGVPAGNSTTGTLVRDAGGIWSEAENPSAGRVDKDFESVFVRDGAAPVWLLTRHGVRTMADVLAEDARYGELAAVGTGRVWVLDRWIGPTGGNVFYERGVLHPEEILADLVAVLHPEAAPGHEFVYYRQVGT